MPTISGSLSGINRPMKAVVKNPAGEFKSEQKLSVPGGGYSFGMDDGDTMEVVEDVQTPVDAGGPEVASDPAE